MSYFLDLIIRKTHKEPKNGDMVISDLCQGREAFYVGKLPKGQHVIYYEETDDENNFYCAVNCVVKTK